MTDNQHSNLTHQWKLLMTERGEIELATAPEEVEEMPQFDRRFQQKFCETMVSMLRAPEYVSIFECFRIAYEYRRSFPWLAESRDSPDVINQDGLAYALRAALTGYIVLEPAELEKEVAPTMPEDMDGGGDKHVEGTWANRLADAVSATIREGFGLERFANHLRDAQVDVAISPPDVLSKHIAAALINYYKRRRIGISPDPF